MGQLVIRAIKTPEAQGQQALWVSPRNTHCSRAKWPRNWRSRNHDLKHNTRILFPIQRTASLAAPMSFTNGGDRHQKFQPGKVLREAVSPGYTKLVTDFSKVQPQQTPCDGGNKHPGSSCFSVLSWYISEENQLAYKWLWTKRGLLTLTDPK